MISFALITCLLLADGLQAPANPALSAGPVESRQAQADQLVLKFRFEVAAPEAGELLRLQDVVVLIDDPQGVFPLVARTVIPVATPPGAAGRLWVGWSDLRHRLRGAGLPPESVRYLGPGICRLKREVQK